MSSQVQKVKSRLSSCSNMWQSHPYITLPFIFVKFTLCHRPNSAVASNDCAKDCLHKDHCTQAFGRNTLSKPHQRSEPFCSVLRSFWVHLSVSIVSNESLLFCLLSDSLLTFLGGSISASLHMVPLCFPCSMCGSDLSFQRECLLTDLLSNCSIAWFIASWKSFMNSTWSALRLTSDKLSLSSNSSWALSWSWGWLLCHLSWPYFSSMVTWLSYHFVINLF